MDKKDIAKKAREFLQSHRLCAFATISADKNTPDVAYMYYIADGASGVVVSTAKNSQKLANISANKHVALIIGQEVEPITLQLEGIAEIISNPDEIAQLIGKYAQIANTNQSTSLPPLVHLSADAGTAFIRVRLTGFKYSDFSTAKKNIFSGTSDDWM